MTATWNPFAGRHTRPTPDPDQAQREADALRTARAEATDQRIKAAVADALTEPSLNERIRGQAHHRADRSAAAAARLFRTTTPEEPT